VNTALLAKVLENNPRAFGNIKGYTYQSLADLICIGIVDEQVKEMAEAVWKSISDFEGSQDRPAHYEEQGWKIRIHPDVHHVLFQSPWLASKGVVTYNPDDYRMFAIPIFRTTDLRYGEWQLENRIGSRLTGGNFE
jgi:hypothetical protein